MVELIARRLLSLVIVMSVVGVIVFTLMYVAPGDPAVVMLGPEASPDDVARLRRQLGLEQPLVVQLGRWAFRVVQGELGESIFLNQPVTKSIAQRAEPTLALTLLSLVVAVGLGVPFGIISAVRAGTAVDQAFATLAVFGVSMPEFWLGINLMLLFGQYLGVLPVAGYIPLLENPLQWLRSLVLPALAIGLVQSALIARITRSAMLDVLSQDYIRTARAKGLLERVVVYRHALRNALVQVVTVIGVVLAVLLSGAVVVETVFNIPGLGRLLVTSVLRRDYPVIQGVALLVSVIYVLVSLVIDVLYVYLSPKVKYL
ncbi:MAG: ABC transporter permease [Armatimonadetes bacterium]|nr:ABC transporter permease [Armatimonadota bacterium]